MAIDLSISIHPRRIRSISEVEEVLLKIKSAEEIGMCKAGVVLMQNRQLGGSYHLVPCRKAEEGINNPRKCEWFVCFYPSIYFKEMKKMLQQTGKVDYNDLEKYILRKDSIKDYGRKEVLNTV